MNKVFVLADWLAFESILPKVPNPTILFAKIVEIGEIKFLHKNRKIFRALCPNKQMSVVWHKTIMVEVERMNLFIPADELYKIVIITGRFKNLNVIVAARHDVIKAFG